MLDTELENKCEWTDKPENSNRQVILLSLTTLLMVCLPIEECKKLNYDEINPNLANKIRRIISEIKQMIDAK